MVECSGLENRRTRKGSVSSNLTHAVEQILQFMIAVRLRRGGPGLILDHPKSVEVSMASSRKMIDCRRIPSERNCSITIAGTEEEVLTVATRHAVEEHGHQDSPELREMLRGALVDEPTEVHA